MEKITKFDLNSAFKALDDIDIPETKSIGRNGTALLEAIKTAPKADILFEDYYDVNDQASLEAAKEDREDEIAKAKLARIEKIVDLDAESPEDLQPSYVGKTIIQCPQCMTLFYKNPEDLNVSEDDATIVNVGEVCQHCGNDAGYTVVGKVGEVAPEESENFEIEDSKETNELDLDFEEPAEENTEEVKPAEETGEEEISLEPVEEPKEEEKPEEEEEKKEESLELHSENILVEQVENALKEDINANELTKKLEEHDEYIKVLQDEIKTEEEAVKNAKNDFIKKMHENNLASLKDALDKAIPEEVKAEAAIEELPTAEDAAEDMTKNEALNEEDEKFPDPEKHEEVGEIDGVKIYHCKNCGKFGAKINDKVIKKDSKEEIEACIKGECKESLEEEKCEICGKDVEEPCKSEEEAKECENNEELKETENFTLAQNAIPCEQELNGADCADDVCEKQPLIAHDEDTIKDLKKLNEESKDLNEAAEITDAEISELFNSDEFKEPISDAEVQQLINEPEPTNEALTIEAFDEIDDTTLIENIKTSLTNVYENVTDFELTGCELTEGKLIVEGNIIFATGNKNNTKYTFTEASFEGNKATLTGLNENLDKDGKFTLIGNLETATKCLVIENLAYSYHIGENLVEGLVK